MMLVLILCNRAVLLTRRQRVSIYSVLASSSACLRVQMQVQFLLSQERKMSPLAPRGGTINVDKG